MTDAVSAGQGGLAHRPEAKLQLARARDGGQSGRVEGGGGAVIRKAGDRASEAERPRGRDFFRPPPGAKDGIDRLRRGRIGRRAGESKSESEQPWASDPRLPGKRAWECDTNRFPYVRNPHSLPRLRSRRRTHSQLTARKSR